MQRSMSRWLACAGLALALSVNAWSGPAATADDDDEDGRRVRQELSVTEVGVVFADPDDALNDTIRITVEGVDLDDAEAVTVSLGEQGTLEVLSASGNQIVARCPAPDFVCGDGDFLLTVSVQLARKARYDDDDEDDDDQQRLRVLSVAYDLTVGAVGPQGDKGEPGPAGSSGISGYEIVRGTTANNTARFKELSVSCPSGKSVLGGGAGIFFGGTGDLPKLVSSFPFFSNNRWFAEAQSPSTFTATWFLQVEVICARVSS